MPDVILKPVEYAPITTPEGAEIVYVWWNGRGTWMDLETAKAERWPQATCEVCGAPAFGSWYEQIDMTQPGDPCKGYRPGRSHVSCKEHSSIAEKWPDDNR